MRRSATRNFVLETLSANRGLSRRPGAPAVSVAVMLAALLLTGSGCVKRTLEVTSDPPGAQLVVNGHPAGFTPATLEFRFHGVYLIELRRSGYQPVRTDSPVPPKFYEFAGPDFVAEVLWPGVIVDERHVHYKLEPQGPVDKEKLLAASRSAAAEAERLVPELEPAPPPNPNAKDRDIIPSTRKPEKPKKKDETGAGDEKKPQAAGEPKPAGPAANPPKVRTIPAPEDVPEIESGRQ